MTEIRRVVTATRSDGRSFVLFDGPAGAVLDQPGRGLTFHELWETAGPLARNEGYEDAVDGPVVHHPPAGGTRFRIVELLPDDQHEPDKIPDEFAAMGASERLLHDSSDSSMHRNDTVDYNIVLAGEVYAITDENETLLHAGDVIVQRGTAHTWHNRSSRPCVFASIMVSAVPLNLGTDEPQWV